jgi:hypothetical protein
MTSLLKSASILPTLNATEPAAGAEARNIGASIGRAVGRGPAARAAMGRVQTGVTRTLENSLNKTTYLNDVAGRYGVNLRGSGQRISVTFDPDLPAGQLGVTRAAEGGRVIRVGPDGIADDATAANTIAHELSHARYYLKNGTFKGEVHGTVDSMGDGTPYGSGNALQEWIEGRR